MKQLLILVCALLCSTHVLNAMDLEMQEPEQNNVLNQLKTAVKNKNINQVQQLLQSAERENVNNFSEWFATYKKNLSENVNDLKVNPIIFHTLAATFVVAGIFAAWSHSTIPEPENVSPVSLTTAIVCYCMGTILFGCAIGSSFYYFKKSDENKFIKSKKQLITNFMEQRKHELNELPLPPYTDESSESYLSKTMNTATSSTD